MEWVEYVLSNPIRMEGQTNSRIRRWAPISEVGKYLRVVAEPDVKTVHSAFFDRGFSRNRQEVKVVLQYYPDTDMLYFKLKGG